MMPSLNFRLPQEHLDWLRREAEKRDRKPGWYLRKLISDAKGGKKVVAK